jgi:hypothetical protein
MRVENLKIWKYGNMLHEKKRKEKRREPNRRDTEREEKENEKMELHFTCWESNLPHLPHRPTHCHTSHLPSP